jgi:hypothetical protein
MYNWIIQAIVKHIVKLMHKSHNVEMKAACSSETSEFQWTKWRYVPENRDLHILYNTRIALQLSHCICRSKMWRIRSEFASRQWTLHKDAETISEPAASDFSILNIIKEGERETWSQILRRVEKLLHKYWESVHTVRRPALWSLTKPY